MIDPEYQEGIELLFHNVQGKKDHMYLQTNMVTLPGIYLDIKRDERTHLSMTMNKVYLFFILETPRR